MKRFRRIIYGVAIVTAAMLVVAMARRVAPHAEGLRAEYFAGTDISSDPVRTRSDALPSTGDVRSAWRRSLPQTVSATWIGSIVLLREGTYTFGLTSDHRSSVFVDGRIIVDHTAGGEPREVTGSVRLTRGVHALFVRYIHDGGDIHLDFRWARDAALLEAVPTWVLRPYKPRLWELAISLTLRFSLIAVEWLWMGTVLVAVAVILREAGSYIRRTVDLEPVWPVLKWILLGSVVLNVTAFWWGLPRYWVPDELTPSTVIDGLSQHFSHGWYDRWPPFHYYALTMAMSPVLVLDALGRIDLYAGVWPLVLIVICRLVSLAAGAGILIAICATGARAFGGRAGLFAAAIFALAAPFVYYSKTANVDVPYVFWFAVSLVWYLRLMDTGLMRDYVLFAASATVAICTKDQAYALYLLMPIAIVHHRWREDRGRGPTWWRVLVDRRLVAAVLTAATLFAVCQNLLFNLAGFIEHVRHIVGPGYENYRAFPPTLLGRLALLWLTGKLIEISWGWPLTLIAVAGVLVALKTARLRRAAILLLAPVLSYYLAFINVILYNYDRFVLPICLILALFGGVCLDRLLASRGRHRGWRVAGIGGVFAYTFLYAATIDALMLGDSRHVVERWMRTHLSPADLIGVSGPTELRPRLDRPGLEISTLAELVDAHPAYYVLSADYARVAPLDSPAGQLIDGLERETLGYRLVFRFRRASPWPWLPGAHPDLVGPRRFPPNVGREVSPFEIAETGFFSILRDINPTIEVFRRETPAPSR